MTSTVAINGRFLTQPITGVQRYAVEVVRALNRQLAASATLRDRYHFRLIAPREARVLDLEHIPITKVGRLQGHAWEQLELPAWVGRRVLLNLCNTAPVLARNVVTMHDAAVFAIPDAYSTTFRTWYRALIPLLARRALCIVTMSEFSRAELSQRAGIARDKMHVVPQGCEHIKRSPADNRVLARLPVSPGRYILAVGSQSPHKNLALLVNALSRMEHAALPLILVGEANPRVFARAPVTLDQGLHLAGYVTDGELRALYENACCFVYPSLYEGFGIPPLEAMICGCPVIVSRAASLPEVCGDAALYCDPGDVSDLANNIRVLVQEPARANELRRRGIERARCYTWDRASAPLVEILDQVHGA